MRKMSVLLIPLVLLSFSLSAAAGPDQDESCKGKKHKHKQKYKYKQAGRYEHNDSLPPRYNIVPAPLTRAEPGYVQAPHITRSAHPGQYQTPVVNAERATAPAALMSRPQAPNVAAVASTRSQSTAGAPATVLRVAPAATVTRSEAVTGVARDVARVRDQRKADPYSNLR